MDEKLQVGVEFVADTSKLRREVAAVSRPVVKNFELNFDKRPLGTITSSFAQFDKSLDAATARVLAFAGTTSVIYGMGAAVRRVVKDFISVEAAMTSVRSITKSTSEEMKSFTDEAFQLANATSTSFSDVAASMQEFARQGLSLEKVSKATAAALTISKLSATDLKQTIDGLVATSNSFANELLDYTEIANTLVAVDAKFATSAGGLIEGIKRVGAVAADAGLEFKELVATIAGVKQVSGRSEAIIGNGLKTIITNLQTDRVQRELEGIGIATKNAAGEFLPLLDVIKQFSNIYNKLDDSKIADITQKIAGKYQINQFKALVTAAKGGNASIISRGISVANQDSDEAKTRLELIGKTTESELIKLNNSLTQFGAQVGGKIAKPVIDELSRIANEGIKVFGDVFSDGNQLGNVIANGIAGILKGPGIIIAFNTIYKLIARIGKEAGQAISSVGQLGSKEKNNIIINQELVRLLEQENIERLQAIKHTDTLVAKQEMLAGLIAKSTQTPMTPINPQFNYAPILSRKDRATLLTRGLNRTAAEGHIPAIQSEQSAISAGVGGARPHAKPVVRKLNLAGGTENAVVNTDEYIVRNYMGSKKDAVFNQDMIRKAGGANKLKSFGNVEKILAGGSIPNLAIRRVYRGYNPEKSLKGLTGPIEEGSFNNKYVEERGNSALRSNNAVDFLHNSVIESILNSNLRGLTNSSSSSPSAALRFGYRRGEFQGLASDLVRVIKPETIERFSKKLKKKGELVSLGRVLYNIAKEKPFGLDASKSYDYVQSQNISSLRQGTRRNPYPWEREINLFDPNGKVFNSKDSIAVDKTSPGLFKDSFQSIGARLINSSGDTRYEKKVRSASPAAYEDIGPLPKQISKANDYLSKVDSIIKRALFGQKLKLRSVKEIGSDSFEQIASGYIPNLAFGGIRSFSKKAFSSAITLGKEVIKRNVLPNGLPEQFDDQLSQYAKNASMMASDKIAQNNLFSDNVGDLVKNNPNLVKKASSALSKARKRTGFNFTGGYIPNLANGGIFKHSLGSNLNVNYNMLTAEDKIKSSGLYFPDYKIKTNFGESAPKLGKNDAIFSSLGYKRNPFISMRKDSAGAGVYGHEYGHFVDSMMGAYIPKNISKKYNFFSNTSQLTGRKIAGGEIKYPNNPAEIFADTYANMVGLPLGYKSGIPVGFPGGRSYAEDQISTFFDRYKRGKMPPLSEMMKSVKNDRSAFFAGGLSPKMIGYHGTSTPFSGSKIDPKISQGEGQGQGFYFWKRKSDAVTHATDFDKYSVNERKVIAGRFDINNVVPDYEIHAKQGRSFLKNNKDLLAGNQNIKNIDDKGFSVVSDGRKSRLNYSSDYPTSVREAQLLGPLFDSLRSGDGAKRLRQFEESLINSKKGRAFRYTGEPVKAYSKNLASGHDPVFESIKREKMALLAMGYAPGESAKSIKVGQLSTLKNSSNPGGFGVYNTLQGQHSLGQAVAQHGGVPNLAKKYGDRRPLTNEEVTSAGKIRYGDAQAAKQAEKDLKKFGSSLAAAAKSVDIHSRSLKVGATVTKSLGDKVKISNIDSTTKTGTVGSGGVNIATNRRTNYGPIKTSQATVVGGPNIGPPGSTSTTSSGPTTILRRTPVPRASIPGGLPKASATSFASSFYNPSAIKLPPQLPLNSSVYGAYGPRMKNPTTTNRKVTNGVETNVAVARIKAQAEQEAKQRRIGAEARRRQAKIDAVDKNGFTRLERKAGLRGRTQEDLIAFRSLSKSDQAVVAKENRQRVNANRSQKAFLGSFIAPIAGAAISELAGGQNTKAGRLIGEGANSAASGLSIAALLGGGPAGIAAGIGVGAYSLASAVKKEQFNPQEQIKSFEKLQSALEERQNLVSGYITALSNVEDLKTAGASLEKVQKAREQSSQALIALGAEAENIARFNGDTEKISNYLNDLQSKSNAQLSASALNKGIAEKSSQYNSGLFSSKQALKKEDADLFAKGLVSSLSLNNISAKQLRATASKGRVTQEDLKGLGLDENIGSEIFTKLSSDFVNASEDVNKGLTKILLSISRYKELNDVQRIIDENRVAVSARVKDLVDSSNKLFEFQTVQRQGDFAKNIGSAERQLGFFSSYGGGSDETAQKISSSIDELKAQNDYNSKVDEVKKAFSRQVSDIAGTIKSDEQRGKALNILPKYLNGDIGLKELTTSFREIANSGREGIGDAADTFTKTLDDLAISMERVKQENDVNLQAIREEADLRKQAISIEKLRTYGGAQLSGQDFNKNLSSYVSRINFKGTDTSKISDKNIGSYRSKLSGAASADAERRIEAYKAAQASGFGIENIADSDLGSRQQRNLKRRKLEERRNTLLPDYESRIMERNRQYNMSNISEEFKKIEAYQKDNKYGPQVIRKEDKEAIVNAIQSGDPTKAGEILKNVKRDNNVENIPQLEKLLQGLSDAITEAGAGRGLVVKQAEALYNKDFAGNTAPQEITSALEAAKKSVDDKQIASFVADFDKSQIKVNLDSIKDNIAIMTDRLSLSVEKEAVSKKLFNAASTQSTIQEKIDSYRLPQDVLGIGQEVTPTQYGFAGSFKKGENVFSDTPNNKITQYAAEQIFSTAKTMANQLASSGRDPLSIKDKLPQIVGSSEIKGVTSIVSPVAGGELEKAILKYAEELKKLQQVTKERGSLEGELKGITSKADLSLAIQISSSEIMKASLDSPEFKELIRKFVTDSYIATYRQSSDGKYPVIVPKVAF